MLLYQLFFPVWCLVDHNSGVLNSEVLLCVYIYIYTYICIYIYIERERERERETSRECTGCAYPMQEVEEFINILGYDGSGAIGTPLVAPIAMEK